ncbi:stage II sporulation protein M [Clostridium boliviensis]|uniref:Stage II sporulation protein M n=1 Tax=Clostridium boliviensis TaxID=318465 RepID=A0ABU4GKP2_9CLOT|nr:stage II sporulation protein M [Clostridium boliviensis]MDW2798185.1 stage II sporulation protein M [Clostridium boliviensis]
MAGYMLRLRSILKRRAAGSSRYIPVSTGIRADDRYLVCFFIGLMAGTVIANFWYSSFENEAVYYLGLLDRSRSVSGQESIGLFAAVLRQRLIEIFIAWLIGMTAYAVILYCLLTAGLGFSMGFVMSVITVQKGLMGLPFFFMTVMPQWLCYLPLWVLILYWGVQKGKRFRSAALIFILLFSVAGSALETWINPIFVKYVL